MGISFRRISSTHSFNKLIEFLKSDVEANGGSAGEIVFVHNTLTQLTVCAVPWGTIVINKPITKLEALAWWHADIE